MMQTIDGVCLRLTVGRQVARCTLRKRSRLNTTIDGERGEDLGIAIELRETMISASAPLTAWPRTRPGRRREPRRRDRQFESCGTAATARMACRIIS